MAMSDRSGEEPIFTHIRYEIDGQEVDAKTWRAHQSRTVGAEIAARARRALHDPFPEPGISAFKESDELTPGEAAVYEFVVAAGLLPPAVADIVQEHLQDPKDR